MTRPMRRCVTDQDLAVRTDQVWRDRNLIPRELFRKRQDEIIDAILQALEFSTCWVARVTQVSGGNPKSA